MRYRHIYMKPWAVAEALIRAEINFLTVEGAGPDEGYFSQEGAPTLPVDEVKNALFNGGKIKLVSVREMKICLLPKMAEVESVIRKRRDTMFSRHVRGADGILRDRSGKPCDEKEFLTLGNAYQRVLEIFWKRYDVKNKTRARA